uniref:UDP-D-xylose:beta-D-glucoside alpha-1,3-D-xylosyltransferase n=1 Tax=Phallusia mammillata TaxID=59560 RepID=A0A6F9DEF6_9ASCI|nr:glucoside xylosyltransferase 1-like [Phallusia mammillata]
MGKTYKNYIEYVFMVLCICLVSGTVNGDDKHQTNQDVFGRDNAIHVAVVACGNDDRVLETLVNIKSMVIFTKKPIKFHIFTEDTLKDKFLQTLGSWPVTVQSKFSFQLHSVTYPEDGNQHQWKKLFKLCASQRLFLPHILSDIDSLLYVDTDILFISPVEDIWKFFSKFNSTQFSAMSPEHENRNSDWYSRFARHPYYGATGINSGVMLMNMTRLRQIKFKNDLKLLDPSWNEMLLPLYKKYRLNITWGDQDLLNIIFHYNPEMLFTFPCKWNYRPDHCMYMPICKSANQEGVKVLHGCRRAFQEGTKWPTFRAVYKAIEDYNFNGDISTIFAAVKTNLEALDKTHCTKNSYTILNTLKTMIQPEGNENLHGEL